MKKQEKTIIDKKAKEILSEIPIGIEYHANRYDTDKYMVLHLWNDKGHSYDIVALNNR